MKLVVILVLVFSGFVASSKEDAHKKHKEENHKHTDHQHDSDKNHDHSSQKAEVKRVQKDQINIKVNGMVCAFCAQGVEKNFAAQKEVKKTVVDMDSMTVQIYFKKGQFLPESKIKKLIVDAGFAYGGIIEK